MRKIWLIYSGLVKLWRGNPNWVQIFLSWNFLLDSNQSLTILEKQILFHYIFAQISPKKYGLRWIIGNIINNPIVYIYLPLTKGIELQLLCIFNDPIMNILISHGLINMLENRMRTASRKPNSSPAKKVLSPSTSWRLLSWSSNSSFAAAFSSPFSSGTLSGC